MSWNLGNNSRGLFSGDSITSLGNLIVGNWPGVPGGFIDQARTKPINYTPAPPFNYVRAAVGQSAPTSYVARSVPGRKQVFSVYGVGGRTISGLQADLPASIYSFAPDLIVLEIGTNDFGGGTNVTPGGAFQVSYNAVLDGIKTNLPNCKVLCLSPPIRSEQWVAAGPHLADNLDTWAGLTRIQESIAAIGVDGLPRSSYCEYVDLITPAFALIRILQPVAGSSVTPYALTQDSLHPTTLGRQVIAAAVMQHINFV